MVMGCENDVPTIVTVPLREPPVVFPATVKPSVLLPVPEAEEEKVIQPALLEADHAHPVPAVIAMLPLPPADGNAVELGATE
jgi:hypothetical protein